ncbi:MAG TPA: PilZ domain-containing protein [Novosphingobium sp.]|nr:PilZ domain-containing protein [Novosphingobium sp.]
MAQVPAPTPAEEAANDELRAAPRYALMLRAGKLIAPTGEFLCILRDASETGVKAKLFHDLPAGDGFELELGNGERYPVEAVWQREGHAGFRFADGPIDIQALVDERGNFPRRQIRLKVNPALDVLVHAGGLARAGRLVDLSLNGVAIECDPPLALRQLVRVEADGLGRLFGRVRWRRGAAHGVILQETFRLDQLAALVARLQLGAPGSAKAGVVGANPHPR